MERLCYRLRKAGSLNNLKLVKEELDPPGDYEVCVEIKAIGLNFANLFTIKGLYRAAPSRDFIPGLEFSGYIRARGVYVSNFQINDPVIGVIKFGSFATHLNLDERYLIRLPEDWSFKQGAGFIVQALTAYYALVHLGNISANQTVLIHSAAGGVGIYAERIAKKFFAFTIRTVGDTSKIDLLKSEGYDEIIVRGKKFKAELKKKLNGRELDLVLDAVGGRIQLASFELLKTTGKMVAYGLSSYSSRGNRPNYFKLLFHYLNRPVYDTLTLIKSNKSITGFNLIWLYDRVELLSDMLTKIEEMNLDKPYIGSVYNFGELITALKAFQSGKTKGKVIVKIK